MATSRMLDPENKKEKKKKEKDRKNRGNRLWGEKKGTKRRKTRLES